MVLCDLLCIVNVQQGCIAANDLSLIPSIKSPNEFVIFNEMSSSAVQGLISKCHRQCCRVNTDLFVVNASADSVVPYVPPNSRRKKAKTNDVDPESPSFERLKPICQVAISVDLLQVIQFDTQLVSVEFDSSFFFVGSILSAHNKSLSVSFVSKLSSKQLQESFQEFMVTGDKFFEKEPFFAGFYLSKSDCSDELLFGVKMLLCKLAPVFIYLPQSTRRSASWFCSGTSSYPVYVETKSPGWVVHRENSQKSPLLNGFDVVFPKGKSSASVVNPNTLQETRVSQHFNVLQDAHKNDLKVPYCNTLMKTLKVCDVFAQLHSETMNIVERDSIWSYIDSTASAFVHILPVLNVKQFNDCNKSQKSRYLKRIAWIVSRSLLVPGSRQHLSDRYFAVRTTGCFILPQKDSVNVSSDEYIRFKRFYATNGADELLLPPASLFTESIARPDTCKAKHYPYSVINKNSNIMHTQVVAADKFSSFRSEMNVIPTLEFHLNSCWLESAISVLFSLQKARGRIAVGGNRFLLSLFDVMAVYGLTYQNKVPIVECMRCGLYPYPDEHEAPPPIFDQQGYSNIFPDGCQWGSYGCPLEALTLLFKSLNIDPVWVASSECDVADFHNGEVICVSCQSDGSDIHERFSDYVATAVIFGNGAHCFSVCKAVRTPDWTVKDALVHEFTTHSSFCVAMSRAKKLHDETYTVQLVVYVK